MTPRLPLSKIVDTMRYLAGGFNIYADGGTPIYKNHHKDYFESWLHEAGHLLGLLGGAWPGIDSDFSISANIDFLTAKHADLNEARALSVELKAAQLFGYPIRFNLIVDSALPGLNCDWDRDGWRRLVRRQVNQSPTTKRYARKIYTTVRTKMEYLSL